MPESGAFLRTMSESGAHICTMSVPQCRRHGGGSRDGEGDGEREVAVAVVVVKRAAHRADEAAADIQPEPEVFAVDALRHIRGEGVVLRTDAFPVIGNGKQTPPAAAHGGKTDLGAFRVLDRVHHEIVEDVDQTHFLRSPPNGTG